MKTVPTSSTSRIDWAESWTVTFEGENFERRAREFERDRRVTWQWVTTGERLESTDRKPVAIEVAIVPQPMKPICICNLQCRGL